MRTARMDGLARFGSGRILASVAGAQGETLRFEDRSGAGWIARAEGCLLFFRKRRS